MLLCCIYLLQGFIFDLSESLKALVIFIEHRYYGKSLPFGQASYQDKDHLGYLTSEQALADFAVLITDVKVQGWRNSVQGHMCTSLHVAC